MTPYRLIVGMLVSAVTVASAAAQTMVSVPAFRAIELEGGGHVVLRYGDVQQVRLLRGSTAFTRFVVEDGGKLRIEACNDDCPRHYDLDVEIVTPAIDALAISGGGAIETASDLPCRREIALAVKGGGTVDARALRCADVTAAVDGGGLIRVNADKNLMAAVRGGGSIKYWGNPRVTEAVEGGGEVEQGR